MPIAKPNPGSTDPHYFDLTVLPPVISVPAEAKGKPGRPRHRDMPKNRKAKWHSDAKKMEVACTYAVTGNSRRTSEITKIPEGTIRAWKQTEWWNEIISRIHLEQNEELDAKLTKLVDKAVDEINDRLEGGDYVYNAKEDKLVRKPVSAKDIAVVTAITLDKRQLLRGEPTSRVQSVKEDERLKRLQEEFRKFSAAREITTTAEVIEEENFERVKDASEEWEVEESNLPEHQDGDAEWEATEAGDSYSDEQSWEEQEKEEQETLTVNELFSE